MSIWDLIEKEAAGFVLKSGEDISPTQRVTRFLKTDRGSELYARYRSEDNESLSDLAEEELVAKATRIAKNWNLTTEDAWAKACADYPDLRSAAGFSRKTAESMALKKSAGGDAYEAIVEKANAMVLKDGDELSQEQRVTRFLNTDDGAALYADYRAGSRRGA